MEHEPTSPQWDVLAAELRAYRDQQKQTWGDVDNALMGRYLAGEATAEERHRVETSFDQHPDLRVLADLVRAVLGECQPVPSQTAVQQPEPDVGRPRLLPFTKPSNVRRPLLMWLRRNGALVAAACLLLTLGVALSGPPLPSADMVASNGWEDLKANRDGDRTDLFFASRDAKSEARTSRSNASERKHDTRSLTLLVSNLEKAQQHRSDESIKEVALGVEAYLAKAPPQTYAATAFLPAPSPGAPEHPPGDGVGAARMSVGAFAAKDATTPQPQQVLADAARVLARGLEQDRRPELQQQCCDALAKIGPVAVPVLEYTLKNAPSPRHKQVAVQVLKQMGPVAQRAAPTLEWAANTCPMPVRGQAEEALRFVYLPCGSAGVNDIAHVLAAPSYQHVDRCIQRLCRKHHVHFVAETVRYLPDDSAKIIPVAEGGTQEQVAARWAEVRRRQVGAQDGVYVLIVCQDSPVVHVALGKDVKAKVPPRLTEQSLRGLLLRHQQDKDKGLEKAVRLVDHELSRAR